MINDDTIKTVHELIESLQTELEIETMYMALRSLNQPLSLEEDGIKSRNNIRKLKIYLAMLEQIRKDLEK